MVPSVADQDLEQLSIDTIRTLAMDSVQQANAGHPGTAMALAPLAYLLYTEVMNHNPANPAWPNRDRFVLSAGHACILQYAALHLSGYNLSLEELKRFRQWDSLTPGHPEVHHTPGVEATTGPLGQGFANGVGFGIAERFLAETFNRPYDEIVDHRTYVICSDGDLMEGVSNEAASIAGTLGLGKLVYFYDDNYISIDGTTWISFTEDRAARFEAQGWHVQVVEDVNDLAVLRKAIKNAQAELSKPSMIVVHSHIAYGAPDAVDTAKAHGSPLGEAEVRATKIALGWDPDKTFVVPQEVAEHFNQTDRGIALEDAWQLKVSAWSAKYPGLRERWDQAHTGKPIPGWVEALPTFDVGEPVATRDAGAKVMEAIKHHTPTMIGGAADLVESTKTEFKGGGLFSASHAGRNIAFGIREFSMGAIVNGISLHDGMLKPYGSTFLIFSDYMRNAVRLSALSRLQSLWVWTHDSVGLGEDGPTHQPVEHYASLRAIPFLWFMRPADATETVGAWKVALEREDGPVALALTRQKVPTLEGTSVEGVARGAYVVHDSDDDPEFIFIATGSEVSLAVEAAKRMDVPTRVVSMPCWEIFEAQPADYRDEILPPDVKARLSVEAGVALGWHKWVGDEGDSISIEHYGASAPGTTVLEKFGYTPENVVARALALRERVG
ncbi:MAG: transketolase [Actinobacteria bacterium]|nr:transketolase [Actinomycetota bacterium]MBV8599770.1 transketolase [Actinomycetota bacterium]